jgi:hypothetical protein
MTEFLSLKASVPNSIHQHNSVESEKDILATIHSIPLVRTAKSVEYDVHGWYRDTDSFGELESL